MRSCHWSFTLLKAQLISGRIWWILKRVWWKDSKDEVSLLRWKMRVGEFSQEKLIQGASLKILPLSLSTDHFTNSPLLVTGNAGRTESFRQFCRAFIVAGPSTKSMCLKTHILITVNVSKFLYMNTKFGSSSQLIRF